MKKTLRTLMMGMMALLGCTALTSCTNDDEPQVAQQEGQKGYVEFTLSRGADTRTTYAANKDGGLDVKWSADDKMVAVYNLDETDEIIEVFDLVSGAGTTTAKFAKSDSQLAGKSGKVALQRIPGYSGNYKNNVFDFSGQTGLLENFADYDFFTFEATLTNGQITNPKYQPSMAVYHFKANDIDFGVDGEKVDFVFGEGTYYISLSEYKKGDITIQNVSLTGGKLDNDLYVAVFSSYAPTKLKVGSKTFELPTGLGPGKIYTFAQENLKAATPLTIEPTSSEITVTISNPLKLTIEYSVVTVGDETILNSSSETIEITVPKGSRLQLFGDNGAYANNKVNTNIKCDAPSKVYGNIMSLISSSNYSNMTALENPNTFAALFKNNTGLTDASGLILPATTLAGYCYAAMFGDCTSLTTAPALNATTLADFCYAFMFDGCTALTQAPALPATTLANNCYADMFEDCTSLTTAPALNATTMANFCYAFMFKGCTALTEAPALPATTLVGNCYSYMFEGCTKLSSVTCLAEGNSVDSATTDWLKGVAASGTFTKAASMTSWTTGESGIPSGWTVKNYGE